MSTSVLRGIPTLLALGLAASASALPVYDIVPLGLTDAEHTRTDGYQSSAGGKLTDSGFAAGTSVRYAGAASRGQSAWLYDANDGSTTRLGYFDAIHTRSDGTQSSTPSTAVTESGYVVGSSQRYAGSASRGQSAWFYDASTDTTTRLGFFDATHTRNDGAQLSAAFLLTESGYAAGASNRYASNGADRGSSAWLFDPGHSTTRVGLFDAEHTEHDGLQFSAVFLLSDTGYVAGTSQRYNGGFTNLGTSGWIYDAGAHSTTRLGYFDATHTSSSGERDTRVLQLTDSGYVAGVSRRYSGASALGQSAWLYDATAHSTTRLGFFDAAHTRSDGNQTTGDPVALTESGYVIGTSLRFDGSASRGQSAWLHDANLGSTTRLGLFDAAYIRNDGFQSSNALLLTDSGRVGGTSQRYNGGATSLGSSVWLYDPGAGSTTRAGLLDAMHTGSGGEQSSGLNALTDSGFAAGISTRFIGGGTSTWLYDPNDGSSTRVGLFDAMHTGTGGYQSSTPSFLVDSGYLAGSSSRFGGRPPPSDPFTPPILGSTAWIFDASNESQHNIILSQRSDGYAFSSVQFLGEDGLALGFYELFGAGDVDLGTRAFAWTPVDGVMELGALVAGGLTAEGWSHLANAIQANGLGMIVGAGRLQTGGDLAYLLTPASVPEPCAGALVTAGLVGLVLRRSRPTRIAAPR